MGEDFILLDITKLCTIRNWTLEESEMAKIKWSRLPRLPSGSGSLCVLTSSVHRWASLIGCLITITVLYTDKPSTVKGSLILCIFSAMSFSAFLCQKSGCYLHVSSRKGVKRSNTSGYFYEAPCNSEKAFCVFFFVLFFSIVWIYFYF